MRKPPEAVGDPVRLVDGRGYLSCKPSINNNNTNTNSVEIYMRMYGALSRNVIFSSRSFCSTAPGGMSEKVL